MWPFNKKKLENPELKILNITKLLHLHYPHAIITFEAVWGDIDSGGDDASLRLYPQILQCKVAIQGREPISVRITELMLNRMSAIELASTVMLTVIKECIKKEISND